LDSGRAAGLLTLALDRSHHEPKEIVMNRIQHICRFTAAVAGVASALLAFAAAALASGGPVSLPPPIGKKHPPLPPGHAVGPVLNPNRAGYPPITHVHTVVTGGMPGWQITLITVALRLPPAGDKGSPN
jgi:hypothetical protein